MRISRMDSLGGIVPPEKPSMKICPPLGPADGPASACNAAASSSGSSGKASRSFPLSTCWLALLLLSVVSGALAFTLTSLSMAAIFKLILKGSRRPAATSTSAASEGANPAEAATTVYLPAVSALKA